MLKRMGLLAALILALPFAAFAGSQVDFTNSGGTLSGSNSGLSLTNSVLIAVNGLNGQGLITGMNLGSFSFTTGALLSGNLQQGGTFASGGSFMIIGNGINGVTAGTIFDGSFAGPVSWTALTLSNGTHNYVLSGVISGTFWNGKTVEGATTQITQNINTGKGWFKSSVKVGSGDTNLSSGVAPEPSTLVLFGTGLLGLAGALRKKLQA